jgi:hypothetical protein
MKRKNLAIRQRTTLAQQLPADHVEKLQSFRTFVQKQIRILQVGPLVPASVVRVPGDFFVIRRVSFCLRQPLITFFKTNENKAH